MNNAVTNTMRGAAKLGINASEKEITAAYERLFAAKSKANDDALRASKRALENGVLARADYTAADDLFSSADVKHEEPPLDRIEKHLTSGRKYLEVCEEGLNHADEALGDAP